MKALYTSLLALATASLCLTACNSGNQGSSNQDTANTAAAPSTGAEQAKEVTLELTGNDQMQYDKRVMSVHAGQEVTLIFHHAGTMPKTAMGHNFVLLTQGTDMEAFDKAAGQAGDNDFIPKDKSDEIIAHTRLLAGGETDTIKFTAPPAGTYTYLCTFPGHAAQMNGKFVVY
jgi:azurin